jgi:hypothetical protein
VVVADGDDAAGRSPSPGRRARRGRTADETRLLAAALLTTLDGAPAGERLERLARALQQLG